MRSCAPVRVTRSLRAARRGYLTLFLISAPAWWLFELANLRTQNWFYEGSQYIGPVTFFLLATLSFSTVMPAVFGTAELVSTFDWLKRRGHGPHVAPTRAVLDRFLFGGLLMLALMLLWPRYFYPLLWLSLYFILDSLNARLGNPSLLAHTGRGDWRPILALWSGILICALFWEMWNYYSYPKWIYHVPFLGFAHIFEMPALGYLGYLPFSMELYALYHLLMGLLRRKEMRDYIELGGD